MKNLCKQVAISIAGRIEKHCTGDAFESDAPSVKLLCESLSILDNIIYASKEDEGGEKE